MPGSESQSTIELSEVTLTGEPNHSRRLEEFLQRCAEGLEGGTFEDRRHLSDTVDCDGSGFIVADGNLS